MMFFMVAAMFAFAEASVMTTNCITIRNINYEKETIKYGVKNPYQMAIDHDTNTLFFSYTARSNEMFKIAYLSLKTGEYNTVSGIHGGFANTVNSKGHIVYMGGEDGIYEFDYGTKTANKLNLKNSFNIWQMFYKDGLYFTTYPEEKAYLYKDGQVEEVSELDNIKTMTIAVNNDNDFVYSNSSGVFMYIKVNAKTIFLGESVVNGFTADIDGNLYFSTPNGIYSINDKTKEINDLAKIDNIYGVAIEGNGNIIYASEENIVRLKPTKKVCFTEKLMKTVVKLP